MAAPTPPPVSWPGHQPPSSDGGFGSTVGRLARAIGAALVLLGIQIGVPVGLVLWGHWPITGFPSGEQLRDAPAELTTASSLVGILTLVAWCLWMLGVVSVFVEAITEIQGRHLQRIPLAGLFQPLARRLVAAALMSASATGPASRTRPAALPAASSWGYQARPPELPPAPGPRPAAALPPASPQPPAPALPLPPDQPPPGQPSPALPAVTPTDVAPGPHAAGIVPTGQRQPDPPESTPRQTIVVGGSDTPWSLAERHLGDGIRWRELYEANRDRRQPDGHTWSDPEEIRPGWELVLPDEPAGDFAADRTHLPPHPQQGRRSDTGVDRAARASRPDDRQLSEYWPVSSHLPRRAPVEQSEPVPQPEATTTPPRPERATVAGIGRDDLERRVDLVGRILTAELQNHGPVDVVGLRVGGDRVDVLLGAPAGHPPEGFNSAAADDTVWRSLGGHDAPGLQARAAGTVPLVPALVTFGATADGALLMDVERMGSLAVEGDPSQVEGWLTAAAKELATAPWAQEVALRVVAVDDPAALTAEVSSFGVAVSTALGDRTTQTARRLTGQPWPPLVVVATTAGSVPASLDALTRSGGTGVAVVAAGPLPHARWRLEIDPGGDAVLHPWGIRCTTSSA